MKIERLSSIAAASVVGAVFAMGLAGPVSAQSVKVETASACPLTITVLSAKYAKAEGIDMQVNDGKTLTKSMMLAGQGQLDVISAVPAPYNFMKDGAAMYASLGKEKSAELAGNLRGLWGYSCGVFLPMVWDESPIKTWDDLKGKKVFTGPPSGAAALDMEQFIEAMTGFKPNVDYTAVRLNWGGAQPAMRDGQLEAYMRPMQVPSALVDELTAIRPLRLLPVTAADLQKPGMQKLISKPGNLMVTLKAHSYEKMMGIEQDMKLPGLGLIQVAGKHVPDDVVYRVTKSFFDNIGEIHRNNPAYRTLTIENPFSVLNVPLHPGAYKYFKEQGVTVPQNLLPPGIS
jgi:hypothetical protein